MYVRLRIVSLCTTVCGTEVFLFLGHFIELHGRKPPVLSSQSLSPSLEAFIELRMAYSVRPLSKWMGSKHPMQPRSSSSASCRVLSQVTKSGALKLSCGKRGSGELSKCA